MPDGREWMCQNLDYVNYSLGIIVGTNCWYYDNNETTYGWNGKKYGLLYTWNVTININIKGWRLPTKNEFDNLVSELGSNSGTKIKSTYNWNSGAGTDNFGFNTFPSGYRNTNGNFYAINEFTSIWSSDERSDSSAYYYLNKNTVTFSSDSHNKNNSCSIRLIKEI